MVVRNIKEKNNRQKKKKKKRKREATTPQCPTSVPYLHIASRTECISPPRFGRSGAVTVNPSKSEGFTFCILFFFFFLPPPPPLPPSSSSWAAWRGGTLDFADPACAGSADGIVSGVVVVVDLSLGPDTLGWGRERARTIQIYSLSSH